MAKSTFRPDPHARFTVFHVLWLSLALGVLVIAWRFTSGLGLPLRLLVLLGTAVGSVVITNMLVTFLVIFIVIPRVQSGSMWSVEVDGYMRSMLGMEWSDAGRRDDSPSERDTTH